MYGIPYSRHRSWRILKKLRGRARLQMTFRMPSHKTLCGGILIANEADSVFNLRNDSLDALRYMIDEQTSQLGKVFLIKGV